MTCYPPTTLLPSPLYDSIDLIITSLCDLCLQCHYDDRFSELEKQQYFDLTMHLIEFWGEEEGSIDVRKR